MRLLGKTRDEVVANWPALGDFPDDYFDDGLLWWLLESPEEVTAKFGPLPDRAETPDVAEVLGDGSVLLVVSGENDDPCVVTPEVANAVPAVLRSVMRRMEQDTAERLERFDRWFASDGTDESVTK